VSIKKGQQYRRFVSEDRIQHWLLVFSFSVLALTGMAQKYSGSFISIQLISLLGGIETVRIIHRIAATLLMLEVVFHLGVAGYRIFVQHVRPRIFPNTKDISDALKSLQFNLGAVKEKPQFGRYSFEEKFEYWAVIWGLSIMILTGFMLWNPIATTHFFPGQFIPAAKSAHGSEALLAVLAILIWHLYHVLVRHFNRSMFTGYLSREEMLELHPRELAEIESGATTSREPESAIAKRRARFIPVFTAISAFLLLGIFQFITFEKTALDTIDPAIQVTVYAPLTLQPSPSFEQTPISGFLAQNNQALEMMWPFSAHTNKDAASFRYWDTQGMVDEECSTCHSSEGLPNFVLTGSTLPQPVSNGLFCTTCHNDTSKYTVYDISAVTFPSGAFSEESTADSNLCITCHMGSKSGKEIDIIVAGLENDIVDEDLEFVDIHGAAPGATFYGDEAQGAYQYEDHPYFGLHNHTRDFGSCTDCHDPHQLDVNPEDCENCHSDYDASQPFSSIRFSIIDYDGDGNISEGIAEEIKSLQDYLYIALQKYASETAGSDIVYTSEIAPYFFVDLNRSGGADGEETNLTNRYTSWTPRLLKAAYNYHYTIIDSGGFAHHPKYIIQLLYDSLESLGADVGSLSRP